MKKKILAATIAGLLALSFFAGCSSKHSGSSESKSNSDPRSATSGAEVSYNKSYNSDGFTLDMVEAADYEYADEGIMNDVVQPGGTIIQNDVDVNLDPTNGRLLIRTVTIVAETRAFPAVTVDLQAKVKELGGYIEYSSMSGTGNNRDLRTAYYTVRVPADKLDMLIEQVGNSCMVTSSSENSSDVTLEYVDTKARIESLRVEYNQLLTLLSEAEDLDTIIILQNRLTEVRYQIESNESRIRVLENQVLYATLTLTVKEVLEETEIEEAHVVTFGEKIADQFEETWENTKEFFQDLLLGIIAVIPGIIFIAVNVAIVLIIVFSISNKRRKARALAKKQAEEKKAAVNADKASKEDKKDDVKEDKKDEGEE